MVDVGGGGRAGFAAKPTSHSRPTAVNGQGDSTCSCSSVASHSVTDMLTRTRGKPL